MYRSESSCKIKIAQAANVTTFKRITPVKLALLIGFCVSLGSGAVYAAGVYEDTAGETAFLFAPHQRALYPRIIRTNENEKDASIYVLTLSFPLRPYLLVELEQAHITISSPADIRNGFGDLKLRARAEVFYRNGRAVRLTGFFRTGSGTRRLFPYSSQSADVGLGVSYVDSLETFHVWGMLGAAMVKREPQNLPEPEVHENFGHGTAGLTLPLTPNVKLSAGVTALVYRSGGFREIYLCSFDLGFSPTTRLILSAHAEAGKREERVSDLSLSGGVRVYF